MVFYSWMRKNIHDKQFFCCCFGLFVFIFPSFFFLQGVGVGFKVNDTGKLEKDREYSYQESNLKPSGPGCSNANP